MLVAETTYRLFCTSDSGNKEPLLYSKPTEENKNLEGLVKITICFKEQSKRGDVRQTLHKYLAPLCKMCRSKRDRHAPFCKDFKVVYLKIVNDP